MVSGKKDFNTLKEITKATDGNLSVQLSKLEEMGYLTSCKKIVAKKTKTTYCISDNGRKEFEEYVMMAGRYIKKIIGKINFNFIAKETNGKRWQQIQAIL